jgi:hypothetical protein
MSSLLSLDDEDDDKGEEEDDEEEDEDEASIIATKMMLFSPTCIFERESFPGFPGAARLEMELQSSVAFVSLRNVKNTKYFAATRTTWA